MRLPKPYLLLLAALFFAGGVLKGQSMIDLTKEEVQVMVKNKHKEFRRDNSVVNQRFNYLKYVNGLRTRTWIFNFTDEDISKSIKMVCDYSEHDEVLEELNNSYEKLRESEWTYMLKSDSVHVTLNRQEWYFSVREARTK